MAYKVHEISPHEHVRGPRCQAAQAGCTILAHLHIFGDPKPSCVQAGAGKAPVLRLMFKACTSIYLRPQALRLLRPLRRHLPPRHHRQRAQGHVGLCREALPQHGAELLVCAVRAFGDVRQVHSRGHSAEHMCQLRHGLHVQECREQPVRCAHCPVTCSFAQDAGPGCKD